MKWPCVSIPSLYGFDLGHCQPGPPPQPQPPAQPPTHHLLAPEPQVVKADDAAVAIDPVVAFVLAESAVPMGARK